MPYNSFATGIQQVEDLIDDKNFQSEIYYSTDYDDHVDIDDARKEYSEYMKARAVESNYEDPDLYNLATKLPQFGDQRLGIAFQNLTVWVESLDNKYHKNLLEACLETLTGYDIYKQFKRFFPSSWLKHQIKPIIQDFNGVIYPGEILLVLGKPGAGCSTFLKTIAHNCEGFFKVDGEICYNSLSAETMRKKYPGKAIYNPADDHHLAALTVDQTLSFASSTKFSKRHSDYIRIVADTLIKMFGLEGTVNTKIGNEYLRGISGGEKKRVSIAEALLTRASVSCWDNSTRGLDSSTAIDYVKSLRILSDNQKQTIILTLYQASDEIFNLVDKVLLIYDGREIFYGPAKCAVKYFEDLGFVRQEGQTKADFLTSITDDFERQYQGSADLSPDYFVHEFSNHDLFKGLETELGRFESISLPPKELLVEQSRFASSGYIVSFFKQVRICVKRQWWLTFGDKNELIGQFLMTVLAGLLTGSAFYNLQDTTEYLYSRGGVMFLGVLYVGWTRLSEVAIAVSNREVVERHRLYAFYRPSAAAIAKTLADLPILLLQCFVITVIVYFLSNLKREVGAFFIFYLFLYIFTVCLIAIYRTIAAISPNYSSAIRVAAVVLDLSAFVSGYMVPTYDFYNKIPWIGWLQYFNPTLYAFDSLMSNELSGRTFLCSDKDLVPAGPGYLPQYETCSIPGAIPNSIYVNGDDYLYQKFGFSHSHIWRNLGILILWTIVFIVSEMLIVEVIHRQSSSANFLEKVKSKKSKDLAKSASLPNKLKTEKTTGPVISSDTNSKLTKSMPQQRNNIFTWSDLSLKIQINNTERYLLNKVSGFVRSGEMLALVGSSGAGKTTLLNTLSLRNQNMGKVSGSIQLNGSELTPAHSRYFAYCEQMDIHDPFATVREAFEFSILLRQPQNIPKSKKFSDVDSLLSLLELENYQDCIIESLSVEIRKLVTIGVELCANPEAILFLDEPTSGLDSQSAYNIARFIRKLANEGLGIICTIHQPSASLFRLFDRVISLTKGEVFFFGNTNDIPKYAKSVGETKVDDRNYCEILISLSHSQVENERSVVAKWQESPECMQASKKLQLAIEEAKQKSSNEKTDVKKSDYTASFATQLYYCLIRQYKHQCRDAAYNYSKFFVAIIEALLSGLAFLQLDDSARSMEKRLFAFYFAIVLPASISNMIIVKYMQMRRLFEAREGVSKIYSPTVLVLSQLLVELPFAFLTATIYWLIWYWTIGLPVNAVYSGFSYLMIIVYLCWTATLGIFFGAMGPPFSILVNLVALIMILGDIYIGVTQRLNLLPTFWRVWIPYLTPLYYYVSGLSSGILAHLTVNCRNDEIIKFTLPPNETSCETYAEQWLNTLSIGKLVQSTESGQCFYCPYRDGKTYIESIGFHESTKWRDFAVLLAFACFNAVMALILQNMRSRNCFANMKAFFLRIIGK